jgi:heme oxygenase
MSIFTGEASSARDFLRSGTADCHAKVDLAFDRFRLDQHLSYLAFLTAHARALSPIETALHGSNLLPAWRPRMKLLKADILALGAVLPVPLVLGQKFGAGGLHGLLYVIEGSRLGGSVLSKRIGIGLPGAYLGAVHEKGEWSALLTALDGRAMAQPASWLEDALGGARAAFALFGRAGEPPDVFASAFSFSARSGH